MIGVDALKIAKFTFRAFMSVCVMSFGIAIFFTSGDPAMKSVGSGLVGTVFGTWMSVGSSKLSSIATKIPDVVGMIQKTGDDEVELPELEEIVIDGDKNDKML